MANSYFQFKQFTVYHDQCGMKVGTDGVLLGAWAEIRNAQNILDIGTGTGLIALMMAQRSPAKIDGVEIDFSAYEQARENVARSPWNGRIFILHQSFQDFAKQSRKRYDLISTNPPYFSNSHFTPEQKRTDARHDHKLNFEEILLGSSQTMNSNGRLNIILPAHSAKAFEAKAQKYHFWCTRKTYVKPTPYKDPKRVLLEFSTKKEPLRENYLVIETHKRHHYTKEYKELTKNFYLNF